MKKNIFFKLVVVGLAVLLVVLSLMACANAPATTETEVVSGDGAETPVEATRTYYFACCLQGHPYFGDAHIAFRYAADYFNVNIVAIGPDGWDTQGQAEAIEQAITKNANGIVTCLWDSAPVASVNKAMGNGIPVVITETNVAEAPGLTYIGLDNYQCGRDTAKELINRAGDSGNVVVMGNWGATNTDAKLKGVKDYLAEFSSWVVIAEIDDKATTQDAIEAGKTVINNYPETDAILGIDSSSGTGISLAMEELNVEAGKYVVIVHDREVSTLDNIGKGYIDATLFEKTAGAMYLSILLMEDWNNGGLKNVPISSDNAAAGINPLPENMYNTAAIIDKTNLEYFLVENLPVVETKLYNK